jgi:hypothetical protein
MAGSLGSPAEAYALGNLGWVGRRQETGQVGNTLTQVRGSGQRLDCGGLAAVGAVIAALISTFGRGPGVTVDIGSTQPARPSVSTLSPPTTTTPPSPAPDIVFGDKFCTTAAGWTVGIGQAGGHYSHCALRIYANANDVESSEVISANFI